MKYIYIIRHAKSNWDFLNLDDIQRPLNERGHNDAPEMAKRLLNKKITIDAFISSTAVRAFTTASYFAKGFGKQQDDIIKVAKLYHAAPATFFEVIANADDSYHSIALFSHNPGITEFVNQLTSTRIDDMPTCGIFSVEADINAWKEFETAEKQFCFFDYPKS